jgi:hypothetical protein
MCTTYLTHFVLFNFVIHTQTYVNLMVPHSGFIVSLFYRYVKVTSVTRSGQDYQRAVRDTYEYCHVIQCDIKLGLY